MQMVPFIQFWIGCFLSGWRVAEGFVNFIGIFALLVSGLLLLRNLREHRQRWDDCAVKWSFRIFCFAFFISTIFVAPFLRFNEADGARQRLTSELDHGIPAEIDTNTIRLPIATVADLQQTEIIGKTVFISKVQSSNTKLVGIAPLVYRIKEKTFKNCDIFGPAILSFEGTTFLEHSTMVYPTGASFDSCLLLQQNRYTFGVLAMVDCNFDGCRFWDIGFAGTEEMLQTVRKGFEFSTNNAP